MLKVNGPHYFIELIILVYELLGSSMSTLVMVCNGLQWMWSEDIKSGRRQLRETRRRGRMTAIQRADNAGKGTSHDCARDLMGCDIH